MDEVLRNVHGNLLLPPGSCAATFFARSDGPAAADDPGREPEKQRGGTPCDDAEEVPRKSDHASRVLDGADRRLGGAITATEGGPCLSEGGMDNPDRR